MDAVLQNEDASKTTSDYTPAYRRQGFLKEITQIFKKRITQILETDFNVLRKYKSSFLIGVIWGFLICVISLT
jgi:sulfite exporter TauE/SafE